MGGVSRAGGGIGIGQKWGDVYASRAANTAYLNDTGKPIVVSVTAELSQGAGAILGISHSGEEGVWRDVCKVAAPYSMTGYALQFAMQAIVPPMAFFTLYLDQPMFSAVSSWMELR